MSDEQFQTLCRHIDNIANVMVILGITANFLILTFGIMLMSK